jgi:choice-of-anchor B domain-containing protein
MRSRAAAATFVVIASLVAGPAGALAQSLNVTLKAHVDNYSEYSDVWGYTSPLGVEIAIIGTTFGTSFVDVTDTDNPTEVLFVPGSSSIWRDIKTYGHYAYIVEDSVGDGIQIVDLSDPHHPFLTNTQSTYVQTSHNDFVDGGAGVLYCVGPTTHVFDLTANPANPTHIGSFSDYYVHDMYARNGLAFMSAIYVGLVTSVDVSSLPTMTTLGDAITDGAFCHNVWLTDSGRYALTTDEVSSASAASSAQTIRPRSSTT